MWIGSHTLSHGSLPRMSDARLSAELVNSKRILEHELSVTVTSLAYPGGAFNARVERMAQQAGYMTAVTVIKGYAQHVGELMRLRRVGVYGVDTQERFIAKVNQTFFHKRWPYPHQQAALPTATPFPTATPLPSLVP
jgi:peptidoglycan/xylan/chitin deacetylase (PgdA/CDA1 family)